ncbi:MAG: Uncharacterized protein AUREO_059890 [Aureobasidium pullulans]|nr:MAG: Uncharacterized protein AUREO_059890 [Aureobasidium pullulans]
MSSEPIPTPQCSTKQYYATNSPWEEAIGYYRAVRHNKNIYISGTTAVDPFSTPSNPRVLHPGDAAAQTRVTIDEIVKAIKALGGRGAESIVRTKIQKEVNGFAEIRVESSLIAAITKLRLLI